MDAADRAQLLNMLPQQRPFRFVDELLAVDERTILSKYTFRHDEFFYPAHFPAAPITPAVILLEAMAQVGFTLHSLYLLSREMEAAQRKQYRLLLTDCQFELQKCVLPGESVWIRGEVEHWRAKRLSSRCELLTGTGELIASARVAGKGVRLD